MAVRKFSIKVDGVMHEVEVYDDGIVSSNASNNQSPAMASVSTPKAESVSAPKKAAGSGSIVAPLQGTVLDIKVSVGQSINSGDVVAIVEAMKMENEIPATVSGVVKSIVAGKGTKVAAGDVIIEVG